MELRATGHDWDEADGDLLGHAQWIRSFEEHVLELAGQGLVHGPAHSSIGQEGGAVGSVAPLRSDDYVNGSHRGHHQFLAKAFGPPQSAVLAVGAGKPGPAAIDGALAAQWMAALVTALEEPLRLVV
ncbi:hypothetical protein [Kutzneria sp. NPDC051319]|uniref:hypothetical protein n=1 Tax=Kutzneria sp. NPDC051319 TaxID=3155047 RepID=UPI0034155A89